MKPDVRETLLTAWCSERSQQPVPYMTLTEVMQGCKCLAQPAELSPAIVTRTTSKKKSHPSKTLSTQIEPSNTATTDADATMTVDIIAPTTSTWAASTTSATPSSPECPLEDVPATSDYSLYHMFFNGSGVVQNPNAPDNNASAKNYHPPFYMTIQGGPCLTQEMLNNCSDVMYSYKTKNYYVTLDLHHFVSNNSWLCIGYRLPNSQPSDFSIVDSDVDYVYGFHTGS
ncbi:hypothetical protein ANO11243_093830 [Dothideomycetidae sp. 11243]|nr:hypothetical protein ANO11243_093830 [fungal sp. No.11243]